MAYELTFPFYAFRLHLKTGGSLLAPLQNNEVLRIREKLPALAAEYAQALQRGVLNKGQLNELLNEYPAGQFIPATIRVKFPASSDQATYPEFDLEFTYYFNQKTPDSGVWAIVPALHLETYAEAPSQLEGQLEEAIRLDFARHRRLQAVQHIVSVAWYELIELKQHPVTISIPNPKELEKMDEQQQDKLLPKVATRLDTSSPACYQREAELRQLAQILTGNFHRNTLIIGPSGTGKTALVWELARRREQLVIAENIWETTASTLIKELMKDTGWQENLSQLCRELAGQPQLLFVRNLMDLFEVGKYEGNAVSMADYLGPYLNRGEVTLITECTEEELALIEIKSPSFLNVFQRLVLKEPPLPELEQMIQQKASDLAAGQQLRMEPGAIQEIIRLSRRFTPYDGMPGRPVRFLENLVLNHRSQSSSHHPPRISRQEVIAQFSEETGMPSFIIDPEQPMDPEEVTRHFNARIFGQEEAVDRLTGVLAAVKTALARTGKPIASLLLVGPTGVGKTELAKQLAAFMFGSPSRMTRFDMSEYATPYAVQRLTGYSYDSEGQLTSAVRKAPFGVLLFDEIEKADTAFFDLLLQVLSEGRLTDSQGKLVNFCSTIIIMTSNVGADKLQLNPIGWQKEAGTQDIRSHFLTAVQKYFRPELFNRIDQIVPFSPLDDLSIRYVLDREIENLKLREGIRFRRMSFTLSDSFLEYLAGKGYNKQYGARQLQRTVRQELVIPMAYTLNEQDIDDQVEIKAGLDQGQPQFTAVADPLGLDLLLEEYTQIAYTDHASALRRSVEQVKEGSAYLRMLSELDLFAEARKNQGEQIWENQQSAERYAYLMEVKEQFEAIGYRIQQLELQLSLSCLQLQAYQPDWVEQLEETEQKLGQEKVNLYRLIHPDEDHCCLLLIGSDPSPLLQFYLQLLPKDCQEAEPYALWVRHNKTTGPTLVITSYDWNATTQPPEKPADQYVGGCLLMKGPAIFKFLEPEAGYQTWHFPPEAPQRFDVQVYKSLEEASPGAIISPSKPGTDRRAITANTLRDTKLGLDREYRQNQLVELIEEHLNNRFKATIDSSIL